VHAPQEVVRALLLGRDLERVHLALLDVAELEDLADRAVLAAGVPPLKHDQKRVRAGVR
jgi:hypothetical protein